MDSIEDKLQKPPYEEPEDGDWIQAHIPSTNLHVEPVPERMLRSGVNYWRFLNQTGTLREPKDIQGLQRMKGVHKDCIQIVLSTILISPKALRSL